MTINTLPTSTDVLIIGAGPTGLALAITLAQAGVDHVVIDKLAAGQNTSRAAVIHAHTMEALRNLGVAERLVEAGLRLTQFSIRDRDRTLVRLDFGTLPTPYAYLLMAPQDTTEKILAARLTDLGGSIRRGVVADNIVRSQNGVRVQVNDNGVSRTIDARYVVGADGMHSLVRKSAGIDFKGSSYEESFVLADVRMEWPHGRDDVKLFFSPSGVVVVAPLPNGEYRIVATMEDAPEHPTAADIQALVHDRGPTDRAARVTGISWSSRFRVHHRLADSYRKGPLLLMGDAAHVHSPAGGQGMNTGLVDANVLGRLLADVVAGRRPDAALDLYGGLRRPAAEKVLHLAGGLTRMATMKSSFGRVLRNARLSVVDRLPFVKRRMAMNLSGLARRSAAELPSLAGQGAAQSAPPANTQSQMRSGISVGTGRRQ